MRNCDCCGASVVDAGLYNDYQHFICETCGFEKFVSDSTTVNADLYENDADYIDDLLVLTKADDLMLWHHDSAIKYLTSNFDPSRTRVLDIGCFNGFFVSRLRDKKFEAYGIDFNEKAIQYGHKEFGLSQRLSTQTIEGLVRKKEKYDVVCMFEVLEHLPAVNSLLDSVSYLLVEGGVVIISTPNKKMSWRPSLDYPPHHLSRFTVRSLNVLLSRYEFKTILSKEQMSSLEIARHYIGSIFRSNDKNSLRGGEFRLKGLAFFLRRVLNGSRRIANFFLLPVDKVLYFLGARYISQIIIAKKSVGADTSEVAWENAARAKYE